MHFRLLLFGTISNSKLKKFEMRSFTGLTNTKLALSFFMMHNYATRNFDVHETSIVTCFPESLKVRLGGGSELGVWVCS